MKNAKQSFAWRTDPSPAEDDDGRDSDTGDNWPAAATALPPLARLRFPRPLEDGFLADRRQENRALVALTISVCLAVHLAAIALDWFLLDRQLLAFWPALGMFALGLPTVIAYAVLAVLPGDGAKLQRAAPYLVAANGPGVSLMLLAPSVPALPANLIILNPIFGLLLSGMLLRQALPAALLVTGFHIGLSAFLGVAAATLAGNTLLLFGCLSLCTIGAWQLERHERAAWMQTRALHRAAVRDALTGLGNRHHLFEQGAVRLAHMRRAGRSLSALMIDVDHFKEFNDTYGHAAGDACLRRIAAEIELTARRPLDLCVRYGGEEFLVLLAAEPPGAVQRAEALRADIERMAIPHSGNPAGVVTVSVGMAHSIGCNDLSLDGLVAAADGALYRAKRAGRNSVYTSATRPVDGACNAGTG